MKKILFVLSSYGIGGTTVSTRNIISVLDKKKYDITLWVLHPEGILKWMFEGVNTIPTCFSAQALALAGWRRERNSVRRFGAAILRFASNNSSILHGFICRHAIKKCTKKQKYDTVIACQEGLLSAFVSFFDCPNCVAWVRCDYRNYYLSNNNIKEFFYYKYNHIVCVAEQTRKNFVEIYSNLESRTVCIHNPQDSCLILSQSNRNDHDTKFLSNKYTIVSVGRLDKVKRFTSIPFIAKQLLTKGLDFRWYIIGDGNEKKAIAEEIQRCNIQDRVIMLGAKSNPHFYIKQADLYVCLSSSEACPRVINEAKILGTPVVSTDFPTVYEYLENGVNGLVVSLDNIPKAIEEMLTNSQIYSNIKKENLSFQFDNSCIIKQLEAIL